MRYRSGFAIERNFTVKEWIYQITRQQSRMGSYFAVIRELGQATPTCVEAKIKNRAMRRA